MSKMLLSRIRSDPKVERVDTDDPCGPIVTLKKGWSFDSLQDNRVLGEDTPARLLHSVRHMAKPYAGPYDD